MTSLIGHRPHVRTFPCKQQSVRDSREFTAQWFNDLGLSADTADTALLLVSEAVTNGVVHAGTEVRVAWSRTLCQRLCCEVTDFGAGFPHRIDADPDAEQGRGMFLIEALALATRVISTPDRTIVQFMLEHTDFDEPPAAAVQEPRGRGPASRVDAEEPALGRRLQPVRP